MKISLRNQLDLALETITKKEAEVRGGKMDKRHLEDKIARLEKEVQSAEHRVKSHEDLLHDIQRDIDTTTECIWPGFHPDKPQMMPNLGATHGEPEILGDHEGSAHRMVRAIYRRCSWGLQPMMGYTTQGRQP